MKVVWFCADRVGASMAGPGIRAVELSRRLARAGHDVVLCAPGAGELEDEPFASAAPDALAAALPPADAFVAQGFGFPIRLALGFQGRLVLDLYDPVQLEQLAQFGPSPSAEQRVSLAYVRARLMAVLARADHVLCASDRQRHWWLGWLGAAGRLAPATLADDPTLDRVLAVVPFGLPETAPRSGLGAGFRAELGIPAEAKLALFWGGLWDWMDPALAVRAAAALRARGVDLHLALLAGARPGGDTMRSAAAEARAEVARLGVGDRVRFVERWIPYAERDAALGAADLAVTAHRPSLEAELAFRTRLLDCLWARLPVAATRGDTLAEAAEREGWGVLASPGDAEGLAGAMAALLAPGARERAAAAMADSAARYRWSRSAEVLLGLLDAPAPRRPPLLTPGEVDGARVGELAAAVGRKVLGRVWKGRGEG